MSRAEWLQGALAIFYGAIPYYLLEPDRPRLMVALYVGVIGCWLTMFLYAWTRWGWRVARSVKIVGW